MADDDLYRKFQVLDRIHVPEEGARERNAVTALRPDEDAVVKRSASPWWAVAAVLVAVVLAASVIAIAQDGEPSTSVASDSGVMTSTAAPNGPLTLIPPTKIEDRWLQQVTVSGSSTITASDGGGGETASGPYGDWSYEAHLGSSNRSFVFQYGPDGSTPGAAATADLILSVSSPAELLGEATSPNGPPATTAPAAGPLVLADLGMACTGGRTLISGYIRSTDCEYRAVGSNGDFTVEISSVDPIDIAALAAVIELGSIEDLRSAVGGLPGGQI